MATRPVKSKSFLTFTSRMAFPQSSTVQKSSAAQK
jgi:hypothetical protein